MANYKDEKNDKMGGAAAKEGRSGARSRLTDDNKGESKSEPTEKSVEVRQKNMYVFEQLTRFRRYRDGLL